MLFKHLVFNVENINLVKYLLPSATKLRQGNIFTGICQSFCSQGEGVSGTPWADTHPQADTPSIHPPGQTPLPSACWDTHPLGRHPPVQTHTPGQTPPWADTPSADKPLPNACWDTQLPAECMLGYTLPAQCMLGYTHPPAQCMLGYTPPPKATAADGRHPTGMYSCLERTSPTRLLPSGEYNYGYKLFNSFSRKKSK